MRIFAKIIFLMLVFIGINGCKESKKVEVDKTITFWHFWSEPNQKKALDSVIADFENKFGIEVETTELSWNDGKTKLFAAFNSKTAPDVIELGSDWVAQFSSSGVLYELPFDSVNIDKYIDYSTAPGYWDNKIYALPWVVNARGFFINQNLLNKINHNIPKDYNQMLESAIKINNLDDYYGFGATGSDEHRLYKKIVSMFWSNRGAILNAKGEPEINSKANIEALEMYVKLSQAGYIETQKYLDNAFTQGKIGFLISGSWLLNKIEKTNPELNFTIALMPGFDEKAGISFAGGEYLAISEQSDNKDIAIKFLNYMTDGINSLEFCKNVDAAGFPADENYYQDEFFLDHPNKEIFAKQLNYAKMTPVHPKWLDIEKIIENATVKAIYGEKSPEESLNEAQEELIKLLSD